MSRRLREKRNLRAANVASLIRTIRREHGWDGMACSYGAHNWLYRFEINGDTKTCTECGTVYSMAAWESAGIQEAIQAGRVTVDRALRVALDFPSRTPARDFGSGAVEADPSRDSSGSVPGGDRPNDIPRKAGHHT